MNYFDCSGELGVFRQVECVEATCDKRHISTAQGVLLQRTVEQSEARACKEELPDCFVNKLYTAVGIVLNQTARRAVNKPEDSICRWRSDKVNVSPI